MPTLNWIGKEAVLNHHRDVPFHLLREDATLSSGIPERSSKAFSLQTATDRFYPDFVCKLKDGRYLIVEYKGEVYRTNDDSREKNSLGELWEKRSHGTCLFLMVSDRNYEAIRAKIRA